MHAARLALALFPMVAACRTAGGSDAPMSQAPELAAAPVAVTLTVGGVT